MRREDEYQIRERKLAEIIICKIEVKEKKTGLTRCCEVLLERNDSITSGNELYIRALCD